MDAPPRNATDGLFVEPYSSHGFDKNHKAGLIVLGALGMLSVTALLPVISFIIIRLCLHPQILRNQPIILCFNLLLADLFQATSFLASFHWLVEDGVLAPTGWCHVQGALLNLGDLTSGFFVLFIALHTAWTIVHGKSLSQPVFTGIVCVIWILAICLTISGPAHYGAGFFVRAGNWCWISPDHETERLVFHYLWTFINEFGTIVVYGLIFVYLSRKLKKLRQVRPDLASSDSIGRAAKYMVLYPLIFVIATLPLAIGRMMTASNKKLPDSYFFGAGSLLASCGWLDAILYTFTRRVLLKAGPGSSEALSGGLSHPSGNRPGGTFQGGVSYGSKGATSPFPFSSRSGVDRDSKTLSGMTWELPGKTFGRQRHQSDEVELITNPQGSSRANTMESSIIMPGQASWPLPPAESPMPGDDVEEPVQRRTMVRIEEEPTPGRAPRKYWRMEPAQSTFE